MIHKIIDLVSKRSEIAIKDSDFTYFFSLLLTGEAIFKILILGYIAAIEKDKDRHRYRLEHSLVRSNGIGDWVKILEDATVGTASQYIDPSARIAQVDFTKNSKKGEWQYDCVFNIKNALNVLGHESEELPIKTDLRRWFRLFTVLRNKTRGHGATRPTNAADAIPHIKKSLEILYNNHSLFKQPWAYIRRNLSGKYRVSPITSATTCFDYLKMEDDHTFKNGIYIYYESLKFVPLIESDPELQDFFFCNGNFTSTRYELLSYYSDDKKYGDSDNYMAPTGPLPSSESEGLGELVARGNCFSNVPFISYDYISRNELEHNLYELLMDDRRTIVTLLGRGGIGKTSLAQRVIPRLYDVDRYEVIVWFSARDVDLQMTGPKLVQPEVLTSKDISRYFSRLVLSEEEQQKKEFNAELFFQSQMEKSNYGSCLFIFDNFETTQNPVELFNWVDTYVRQPNKILITTRLREFKGDYPIDVHGMKHEESLKLINKMSIYLGIDKLLTTEYKEKIFTESGGHPYVIKILLGEISNSGNTGSLHKIIAGSDEVLTALFERTYAALSPCSQRIFLTLASWNSAVPRLVLEAVLMQSTNEPLEVEKGIDTLIQFSLAESFQAPKDSSDFITLPMVATTFGKKKLNISPLIDAIKVDVKTMQMFGISRTDDIQLGLANRIEKFLGNISKNNSSYDEYKIILDKICWGYNSGWLIIGRWLLEQENRSSYKLAQEVIRLFLENEPNESKSEIAWSMLSEASRAIDDTQSEAHALIERSKYDKAPFPDISNAANRINLLLHEKKLNLNKEVKIELVKRLSDIMERRKREADANDLSRMAWLALHIENRELAIEYVVRGLEKDKYDIYCLKLAHRLKVESTTTQ